MNTTMTMTEHENSMGMNMLQVSGNGMSGTSTYDA